MKYAVEMGSEAMEYTNSFIRIEAAGGHRHTADRSHNPAFIFQKRKVG
jgi:hypothetical protein